MIRMQPCGTSVWSSCALISLNAGFALVLRFGVATVLALSAFVRARVAFIVLAAGAVVASTSRLQKRQPFTALPPMTDDPAAEGLLNFLPSSSAKTTPSPSSAASTVQTYCTFLYEATSF